MEWLPNLILFLLDCFKKLQIKTRVSFWLSKAKFSREDFNLGPTQHIPFENATHIPF